MYETLLQLWKKWVVASDESTQVIRRVGQKGHIHLVRLFLANGADVDELQEDGSTALHSACCQGHAAFCLALLEHHADPNLQNGQGQTPLALAGLHGHDEIVSMLLNAGAGVDILDYTARAALHQACQQGHLGIVQMLTHHGAHATLQDEEGWTPLHTAVARGHAHVARHLLLKAGVELLLLKNNLTHCPVDTAAYYGRASALETLLDTGIVSLAQKDKALYWACHQGHAHVINLLLHHGARITSRHLHVACQNGHASVLSLLLSRGADPTIMSDSKGNQALHVAAAANQVEIVQILLDYCVDVNVVNHASQTALHRGGRHSSIAQILIENGADTGLVDCHGDLALFEACQNGTLDAVYTFLKSEPHFLKCGIR